ncbi:hypothetical protein C9374_011568 [Naegleria lovaniensis]|uniref:Uncharacterized protein n=1 Tax=Naegleria lovaniensis TaxID=51637 RepID=A0AA88GFF5_NAELO|nr:uncharacterized protein C9374_011568 [Naegleria lovaniensis]KAG2373903.1 hypothetical protein C9374_011568 [Naegleria lovaniensis]
MKRLLGNHTPPSEDEGGMFNSTKKTKFNDSSMVEDDSSILYEVKSRKFGLPANVKKFSKAGIQHGIAWVLDNDKLFVWDIKKGLANSRLALCLENVPMSETVPGNCFISLMIPSSQSESTNFSLFFCTPEGKYKYWYDISLEDEESQFKFEVGNLLRKLNFCYDSLCLTCIAPNQLKDNHLYLGTKTGYFFEIHCLPNGEIDVTTQQKAYGSQNASTNTSEGLFSWLTSWNKTTSTYSEPEAVISIRSSDDYFFILTENSLSKYTEQGKELCWRREILAELKKLNFMKKYSLRLINIAYDEPQGKIFLLSWCTPEVFDSNHVPLVNYLVWPLQIHDRFMDKFIVESPVTLLSVDYNENNEYIYNNSQMVFEKEKLFVSILETLSVFERNRMIQQIEAPEILCAGSISIADICIISRNGDLTLVQISPMSDSESDKKTNDSQLYDQDLDNTQYDPEISFANVVLGLFRKRNTQIESNASIRSAVVKACELLVDSIPLSGSLVIPIDSIDHSVFSEKLSILISKTLQKKLEDYTQFIIYLQDCNIFQALSRQQLLQVFEYGEKIFVCMKLRELQNELGGYQKKDFDILIAAMNLCKQRKLHSNVENFYIEVSKVHEFIDAIQTAAKKSSSVTLVNRVYQCFIDGICSFREMAHTTLGLGDISSTWTSEKSDLIVNLFYEQFKKSANALNEEYQNSAHILNQMFEIADFLFSILRDLKQQDNSRFHSLQFEQKRDAIISTFKNKNDIGDVSPKSFALTLAEKYKDFKHLIQLTEERHPLESERIAQYSIYIRRFNDFASYLFSYLKESKRYHELLGYQWSIKYPQQVGAVVESDANLRWLHSIQLSKLDSVQQSLTELTDEPSKNILKRDSLITMRNRLSLLKLASLASNDTSSAQDPSYFLKLVFYQEKLATDFTLETSNNNWTKESFQGAVELMISVYNGIPSDTNIIRENQEKLLERLRIACDIYCMWREREGGIDDETQFNILLNIYTAAFYVSYQLLAMVNAKNIVDEEKLIRDSILHKLIQENTGKSSAATEQLKKRLLSFFSKLHLQSVFDLD